MPTLPELYACRATLAYVLEHWDARPQLPGTDFNTALRHQQTLTTYAQMQADIRALEHQGPARWQRPGTLLGDWCCPRVAQETGQGPACCGVSGGDAAARAQMWAVLGEVPRGSAQM